MQYKGRHTHRYKYRFHPDTYMSERKVTKLQCWAQNHQFRNYFPKPGFDASSYSSSSTARSSTLQVIGRFPQIGSSCFPSPGQKLWNLEPKLHCILVVPSTPCFAPNLQTIHYSSCCCFLLHLQSGQGVSYFLAAVEMGGITMQPGNWSPARLVEFNIEIY